MASDFYMDTRDLKRLEKALKKLPRETMRATAGFLNSLAFKKRELDIENIKRSMVIRENKIFPKSLIVIMAKTGPIELQVAYEGSLRRPRFSGWREQETGEKPQYRKGFAPAARRNNFKNKTIGKSRLHPNVRFARHTDFDIKNVKSEAQRIAVFLKLIKDRKNSTGLFKTTKSFIMPKYKGWSPGLYGYSGGRFQKYQDFEDANKAPRRTLWHTASINSLRLLDKRKIWAENFRRALNRSRA